MQIHVDMYLRLLDVLSESTEMIVDSRLVSPLRHWL